MLVGRRSARPCLPGPAFAADLAPLRGPDRPADDDAQREREDAPHHERPHPPRHVSPSRRPAPVLHDPATQDTSGSHAVFPIGDTNRTSVA